MLKQPIFLSLFLISCFSWARQTFEKPYFQKTISLGESQYSYSEQVKQNCFVFENHAVIEIIDPGLTGSLVKIRPRTKTINHEEICADKFSGKEIDLKNKANTFWGAYKNFVFLRAVDQFSDRDRFEVYDSLTGENLWSAHRSNKKFFDLKKSDDGIISLEYYHHLRIYCEIVKDKSGQCWKRVYDDYKIPKDIKIDPPNCKKSFLAQKVPLKNEAFVFLKIRIPNLQKPVIKYLSAPSYCVPAP